MFKSLLRKLAGPDEDLKASAFILTEANERLRAENAALKEQVDRLEEEAAVTAASDDLRSQLATRDVLLVALLLKHGDTTLSGHLLAAADGVDFSAEATASGDGMELSLRG